MLFGGNVKVYLLGDMCFVKIEQGFLLCIGTLEEVSKANEKRVIEMVWEAVAICEFQKIELSEKLTLH